MSRTHYRHWTNEQLFEEAKKYQTRSAFEAGSGSAYVLALRKGILGEITGHMKSLRRDWTFDEVHEIASRYTRKAEFRKANPAAHRAAYLKKWLDQVTAHMVEPSTGINHHLIYQIEFVSGMTYIGLSCSLEYRIVKHREKGTVSRYIAATGDEIRSVTVLAEGLSPQEAKARETLEISQARNSGRPNLNRHPGGSLGAFGRYHLSQEAVLTRAKPFSNRTDFRNGDWIAYARAKRMNWLPLACAHMDVLREELSAEQIAEVAKDFVSRGDFQKLAPNVYAMAYRREILDQVCAHMKPVRRHLTDEQIALIAREYASRTEFQKGDPGAYDVAWRRKILDQICTHMSGPTRKSKQTRDDRRSPKQ